MKKNLLSTLMLLLLFIGVEHAFAQSIKGTIVDKATREILPGTSVVIDGTTHGTMTDFDGVFNLKVEDDKVTLRITFVGFIDQMIEVNVDGQDKDLGTIEMESDAIGLEEVVKIASIAKDRSTPVSISNIKPELIAEKLGTQEYPEILKSTPSVYTTKTNGGYGDGRINMRGFDSNNIGVLINGVPVNDMESGKVYWSNWAGLSDVTRTMQVQRGLGASKLAISSVGGTINIITKSTDAEKGGSVNYGIGNDNYAKKSFTVSTGLTENEWAITLSGSQTSGNGYIKGTEFNGYSYFLNISKRINARQTIALTAFGAPQWHNQRSSYHSVQEFRDHPNGIKYNCDFGYINGKSYNGAYAFNKYHKPQVSLNHSLAINQNTSLSTVAYGSMGRGYGRRIFGANSSQLTFQYPSGIPNADTRLTPDGYIDFESVISDNAASLIGSRAVVALGANSHDWYGVISTLNTKINNINFTAGVDARYYKGFHYYEIEDLLGGEYFLDASVNLNRSASTPLHKGDKISYHYTGENMWEGGFLQGEYVKNNFSAFLSGTISNTAYRRTDFFNYTPDNQKSEWVTFLGYSGKGGLNYNINSNHNVFLNGGYFTRAPFLQFVFMNKKNDINEKAKNERVISSELGYGYRVAKMKIDLTLYRTSWLDKSLVRSMGQLGSANITGLNALHQGIELEAKLNPSKKLDISLMGSYGDWKWDKNVSADVYDNEANFIETVNIYAAGIHVGDAAQTTAAVGIDYEILPKFKIGFDYNYYARLFAQFDITTRSSAPAIGEDNPDSWEMPSYQLIDFNVKYKFNLGKLNATLYGKINNLLDTEYISDGVDGANHNVYTSPVFFGFGRTWSMTLDIKF